MTIGGVMRVFAIALCLFVLALIATIAANYYYYNVARLKEAPSIKRSSFWLLAGGLIPCGRDAYYAIDDQYVFGIRKRDSLRGGTCPGPADLTLYGRTTHNVLCTATRTGHMQRACPDETAKKVFEDALRVYLPRPFGGQGAWSFEGFWPEQLRSLRSDHEVVNLLYIP